MRAFRIIGAVLSIVLLTVGSIGTCCATQEPDSHRVVIGVISNNEPGFRAEFISPTILHLKKNLPEYAIELVEIPAYKAVDVIGHNRPHFLIAPPDVFYTLINTQGAQALVTRKTNRTADAGFSVGSTVIVRADRSDIEQLSDLRNKRIAASLPDSLGGWLAFRGELHGAGFDDGQFFKSVNFLGFELPEVVDAVLSGRADVGVLSACRLEMAESLGLFAPGQFRVINSKHNSALSCQHSTALYPDQVFGVLDFSRADLVKQIAAVLLTMPDQAVFSWQVSGRLSAVNELHRILQTGPYMPKPWRFLEFYRQYRWVILGVLALIVLLVLDQIRLGWLVRRRTADLQRSLDENRKLTEDERKSRERISLLERHSLVSNMSSMIAHELKQPLAAIINYSSVISMGLEDLIPGQPKLENANDQVAIEARRISDIVDRVRQYARRGTSAHVSCDLTQIVRQAAENFRHYREFQQFSPQVRLMLATHAMVDADALELEIVVLNLLKNAARAMRDCRERLIVVQVEHEEAGIRMRITDVGPNLSDQAFERLMQASDSTNPDGLGLGLSIIRGIADSHGAKVTVSRNVPQGVCFTLLFPSGNVDETAMNKQGETA